MIGAKIPYKLRHKYIGRGQYPKIVNKPIVCTNKNTRYVSENLNIWGEICSKLEWYIQARNNSGLSTDTLLNNLGDCLQKLLEVCIHRWPDGCSLDKIAALTISTYNVESLNEMNMAQLDLMHESAEEVFNRHLADLIAEKMHSWNTFVKTELQRGGGLLFKFIFKEEKDFMRVDLEKLGGDEFNPTNILNKQIDFWSKYWSPKGENGLETKKRCSEFMEIYRDFALPEAAKYSFTRQDFLNGLRGFNRSSRGADFFTTK